MAATYNSVSGEGSSRKLDHEDAKGETEIFEYAPMKFIDLCRAVVRKLHIALDFLRRKLAQVLFNDVADMAF